MIDEGVRVRPVGEQVGRFNVIHSDVHVSEGFWEKVVNLSGHIQNVADAEKHAGANLGAR